MAKKKESVFEVPKDEEINNTSATQEVKKEEKEVDTSHLSKAERTRLALLKQPKRTIFIPKEPKESEGAFETVQINGYTLQIKKGVYVEVPEQVANIIIDSQNLTNKAYEDARKALSDPNKMEFDNSK